MSASAGGPGPAYGRPVPVPDRSRASRRRLKQLVAAHPRVAPGSVWLGDLYASQGLDRDGVQFASGSDLIGLAVPCFIGLELL